MLEMLSQLNIWLETFGHLGHKQTTLTPVLEKELPRHLDFCCKIFIPIKIFGESFTKYIMADDKMQYLIFISP